MMERKKWNCEMGIPTKNPAAVRKSEEKIFHYRASDRDFKGHHVDDDLSGGPGISA